MLYLTSLIHTSKYPLVLQMDHQPQSHGILYTHCFVCWASITSPVFINVLQSVCLVLKMVLTLKWFPVHLPLIHGKWVAWYIVYEGQMLLDGFIIESTNSCGYSLGIWSCFTFLISLLKSFWSWHKTLVQLIFQATWPNHESVDVSEPLTGFVVWCNRCISTNCSINILLTTGAGVPHCHALFMPK
jgi:hypothetical protein